RLLHCVRAQLVLASIHRSCIHASRHPRRRVQPAGESPGAVDLPQLSPPPRASSRSDGALDPLAEVRGLLAAATVVPADLREVVAWAEAHQRAAPGLAGRAPRRPVALALGLSRVGAELLDRPKLRGPHFSVCRKAGWPGRASEY